MRRTLARRSISIMLALLSLSGCASVAALQTARESFDRTKAAGAESKSPYEYFMAESYLKKAEHEATEGDRDQARDYAAKSEKFSLEALEKAKGGTR
ncbi:MAG TPA: DUF4398 domain-containing protein [Candidatus Deferrimicrobiaceae bacterium]